jgi:Transposase DDE domain
VRDKESPVTVLERLWKQLETSGIRCNLVLMDRYFFNVKVMQWLQQRDLPFIIPAVVRGRKPKKGKAAKGLRAYLQKNAGAYAYTHTLGSESVAITIVVNYRSYRHQRSWKRRTQKLLFAVWKKRGSPTEIREIYRRRFAIETSYRQLNQSRARTTSRDPLYRLLLVGLALLLRNLWQWLTRLAEQQRTRQRRQGTTLTRLPRYKDVLHAFAATFRAITPLACSGGTS